MMRQALKAGVLIATACIPLLVQGQWKWRDAEGRMQYSDRAPPRGTADKDILTRPAHAPLRLVAESPSTSAASSPQGKASSPAEAARRASEPASVHPNKADEARRQQQRSDNCHRAQEYARTLDEGQRVQRVNAQGEREFLDEGQRSRERDKARQVMDAECS
ncbi:MAG: DUF4124 domain-containing protein [Leptothrix ochracea]|uniref:DUF4124 domain-containing protein n=2 Tax=Leptothrix ochracea TaxID=735331 RepID=UPI0034E1BE84